MIVKVLMSRSVLIPAVAVCMLLGIAVLRFEVDDPGVMVFAIFPIILLAMLYGISGGLASAAVACAVFLVWAFTRGNPSAVETIDEPVVFFTVGLLTGMYANGALGDADPRHAIRLIEFRSAIRRGDVVFHYQPLANARAHRVVAFEALARWQHPNRGLLEPAEFIALAERDEQTIWDLTMLAIDRSLADLRAWGELADGVSIWINLSPVSLGRRDLPLEVSPVLEKHGFPASRLAMEITENALVEAPRRAADALSDLKHLGMKIVLDDFGAGRSSISRLGQLPIDTLKVDLALIGPPSADDAPGILTAVVELARALSLQIVAERVEDDATWTAVAEMGVDLVQGTRLCPPLPAHEVRQWLQHPGWFTAESTPARRPQ